MSYYLFNENHKTLFTKDRDLFIQIIDSVLTDFASKLYWVVKYYCEQSKQGRSECEEYSKKYETMRDQFFAQRSLLNNINTEEELKQWYIGCHDAVKQIEHDFVFLAAISNQEDKWIVNCDINQQMFGVLSGWFNDLKGFSFIINDLSK